MDRNASSGKQYYFSIYLLLIIGCVSCNSPSGCSVTNFRVPDDTRVFACSRVTYHYLIMIIDRHLFVLGFILREDNFYGQTFAAHVNGKEK